MSQDLTFMIYLILTFLLGNSSFCIYPKQYALDHIKHVGCMLKEVMSGEVMTLSVINKINNKLKFIHGKKTFLTSTMRQLLYITCISSISFWLCLFCLLSQLNQKKKKSVQSIYFCLQLYKMTHMSYKEFETFNWLILSERFKHCINSVVFKYFNDQCTNYFSEVFERVPEVDIKTRGSFQKLKCLFC